MAVNAALVTVMGGYAGHLSPWMLQLATTASNETLPTPTRVTISAASRWLRIAEAAAWSVSGQPGTVAEQALLRAIPVNVPPPRRSPRGDEAMPDLCTGATATAQRLRHLAHVPATRRGTTRTGLAVAWQRTAQGAAIAGHCSELILHQLAESAGRVPISQTIGVALKEAAHEISGAWSAWRAVTHQWDTFTTGPGATLTPVCTAIGDLTLWVGRLAYVDPAWIPARRGSPEKTMLLLSRCPRSNQFEGSATWRSPFEEFVEWARAWQPLWQGHIDTRSSDRSRKGRLLWIALRVPTTALDLHPVISAEQRR
jgi:hypothetical protein